jgi:hypothetical protein
VLFKRTPFITPRELSNILESCERVGECLIYRARSNSAPNTVVIRGQRYCINRVIWAETHGFTSAALDALDNHEVVHLCANTGDMRGGVLQPMCIAPEHLQLDLHFERNKHRCARAAQGAR